MDVVRRKTEPSSPEIIAEHKRLMDEFWKSISPIEEATDEELNAYVFAHASDELRREMSEARKAIELARTHGIRRG